jgi:hypothetical protein
MTIERLAKGVLMVGSVPLSDAEEVFRTCAGTLSDRLTSLPDGETGARLSWLGHQRTRFDRHPQLERFEVEAHIQPGSSARYRVKAGSKLRFDSLGYSEFARNSYAIFQWLQSQSVIRESIRFQVSMLAKLRRASPLRATEAIRRIAVERLEPLELATPDDDAMLQSQSDDSTSARKRAF